MNYLKLVNKENRLLPTYRPGNMIKIEPKVKGSINPNRKIWLVDKAWESWCLLVDAAKKEGFDFYISSGYRSYYYQNKVLSYYIEKEGVDVALSHVAPPGASEHQTGLALDYFFIREDKNHYDMEEDDPEYIWIKQNAHKYGFILRYPKDKEEITGYIYEPWHLRYAGEKATHLFESKMTLEEYYEKEKIR